MYDRDRIENMGFMGLWPKCVLDSLWSLVIGTICSLSIIDVVTMLNAFSKTPKAEMWRSLSLLYSPSKRWFGKTVIEAENYDEVSLSSPPLFYTSHPPNFFFIFHRRRQCTNPLQPQNLRRRKRRSRHHHHHRDAPIAILGQRRIGTARRWYRRDPSLPDPSCQSPRSVLFFRYFSTSWTNFSTQWNESG